MSQRRNQNHIFLLVLSCIASIIMCSDPAFSTGTITGQVIDINGNPVSNAYIYTDGSTDKGSYTSITGTYTISDLINGTYAVYYGTSSVFTAQYQANIVVTSSQTTLVDFVLVMAGIITGRVTDSNGNPVANAQLKMYLNSAFYKTIYTSATGTYTITGLSEGSYTINYVPNNYSDYIPLQKTNITVANTQIVTVDFLLVKGGIISGQVTDSNGNPISNAQISINYKSTYTATTGTYTISGLNEGTYSISCTRSGFVLQQKTVTLTNGQTTVADFRLLTYGIISGQVTDINGNPVNNAYIYDSNNYINTYTSGNGTYTLTYLNERTYSLNCQVDNTEWAKQLRTDIIVTNGKITTVNFSLVPAGIISGRVTDYNGNPVGNAYISINGPTYQYVYTSSTGTYAVHGLSEGTYTIYYQPNSNSELIAQQKTNITVTNNQTTTVDFSLILGGTIAGKVTDYNGNPVSNAYILASGQTTSRSAITTSSGIYTVYGLDTGTYTVSYNPSIYSELASQQKTNITVTNSQITTADFSLVLCGIITGRVTDTNGNPVYYARIAISGPTNKYDYTSSTGTYAAHRLSAGTYTVFCDPNYYTYTGLAYQYKSNIIVTNNQIFTVDFSVPTQGKITGKITDANGNPLNNVYVTVSGPTYKSSYTSVTGTYTIYGLNEGTYTVSSQPPNSNSELAVQQKTNIVVNNNQTVTVDFSLSVSGTLTGKVTDTDGNPASNVCVSVSGPTSKSGYTSTAGIYTIYGLNEGTYIVTCQPNSNSKLISQQKTNIVVTSGQTTTTDFSLVFRGIATGRVTDNNGNPINNAYISYVFISSSTSISFNTYSTITGTYTIRELFEGTYSASCQPNYNYNSELFSQQKTDIIISNGQITTVNFPLVRGGIITGRVTDTNGNPVVSAAIYVANQIGYQENITAYTNANGVYTVPKLSEGIYLVRCRPNSNSELVSQQKNNVTVTYGQTTTVDFSLVLCGKICGKVTDYNGNPVNRASVSISGSNSQNVYTAATGTYTVVSLTPGSYSISCSLPYYDNSGLLYQSKTNITVIGGQFTTVDFSLNKGGTIIGRVTDPNGNPVNNAYIRCNRDNPYSSKDTYTTIAGTYSICGLNEGTYTVSCSTSTSGLLDQQKTNIAVSSGQITTADFSLNMGGIIAGRVTDPDGNPVSNAYINCTYPNNLNTKGAYSASSGTFTICGLIEGAYIVTASNSMFALQRKTNITVIINQTTTIDFSLIQKGIITGLVTDYNGNPLNRAYVSANGPTFKSSYTSITGTYTITGLDEGTYVITCRPDYSSDLISQQKTKIIVTNKQTTAVDFSLIKGGTITGKIVDTNGNKVPYASVFLRTATGNSTYSYTLSGISTGEYSFSGLVEGNYTITCSPSSSSVLIPQQKTNITVSSGQTATVDFSLVKGGIIAGQVTGPDGNAINKAYISVSGATNKDVYTVTNGTYTIYGLSEGTYTVSCTPPNSNDSNSELVSQQKSFITVVCSQTATVDFSLPVGGTIYGIVTDFRGYPVKGAVISVEGPVNKYTYTTIIGTYSIQGLAEGNYLVSYTFDTNYNPQGFNTQRIYNVPVTLGKPNKTDFILSSITPAINGTVYHSDGKTLFAETDIKLYPAETKFTSNMMFNTIISDKRGDDIAMYRLFGFNEGLYDVYAVSGTTIIACRQNVNIQSSQVTYLDLVDESGKGSIRGVLGSYSISSLSYNTGSAMVWVTCSGSERLAGYAFIDVKTGTFAITGLTSGEYNVYSYVSNVGLNKLSAVQVTNGAVTDLGVNYSVNNIPIAKGTTVRGSSWQVEIPTGCFTNEIVFYVNPRPSSPEITDANDIMPKAQLPEDLSSCVWEVHVTNVAGTSVLPTKKVKLTFKYPDLNQSQASLTTTNTSDQLAVYVLRSYPPPYPAERKGMKWVLLDGAPQIDSVNKTVSTEVSSFSYFRLALKFAARQDLSVRVYPNPYRPATDSKLTFSGLTQDAEIKIYNLVGEEVKSISKNDGTDKAFWYGDNDYKENVASGIYIYVIKNSKGQAAKGKIAVIR